MTNEELAALARGGDCLALMKLWGQVQRMIYKQATRWAAYGNGGATVEDLTQAGFIAVLRAVDSYDPTKAKFSTYLFQYLRSEFSTAAGQHTARARLDPLQNAISLDSPLMDDEDTTLGDFIYDPTAEAEIMAVDERDRRTRLRVELETVLSSLPDEEQRTIRARYYRGQTLDAIATAEGISKVTVSRREQSALRHLRHPSRSKRLKEYL